MPRNSEAGRQGPTTSWPTWAKVVASLVLLWHFVAVLAYEFDEPPQSLLEHTVAEKFYPYLALINEWQKHQYYAPTPPDTPIVLAVVHFADGRPDRDVRLPDARVAPRLRFQRRLAFAFNIHAEAQLPPDHPLAGLKWRAYARYLCRQNPGCSQVDIYFQWHKIPDLDRAIRAVERGEVLNIDGPEYYSPRYLIGEYPCQ
jgi:hypothetical protein